MTRRGDEIYITIEMPVPDYAQFLGFADREKVIAKEEGRPVSEATQRSILLGIWREFWDSLPNKVRRAATETQVYRDLTGK